MVHRYADCPVPEPDIVGQDTRDPEHAQFVHVRSKNPIKFNSDSEVTASIAATRRKASLWRKLDIWQSAQVERCRGQG